MKTVLTVCCESISTDQQTNVVSIFGIFEEVRPEVLPVLIPKLTFLTLFERTENEAERFDFTFELKNNDREIIRQNVNVNFGGKLRTRLSLVFGGVPVQEAGTVSFRLINANNVEVAAWTLPVIAPPVRVASPPTAVEARANVAPVTVPQYPEARR